MKYNLSRYEIRKYIDDGEVYIDGMDIFENGLVSEISVIDSDGKNIKATVKDNDNIIEKANIVRLWFDYGYIIGSSCSCGEEKCSHISASLFAVLESKDIVIEKLASNENYVAVRKLVRNFEKSVKEIADSDYYFNDTVYSIEPELKITLNSGLSVRFFIGKKKMYSIKDLPEFLKNIEMEDEHSYGGNVSFVHKINSFTEKSKKIILFIKKWFEKINDMKYTFSLQNFLISEEHKNVIVLSKSCIDDFFDIFKNEELKSCIVSEHKYNKTYIEFTEQKCDIKLSFDISNDGFAELKLNNNNFFMFEGERFCYILSGNKLYRVLKDYFYTLKKVYDVFKSISSDKLVFLKDDVEKFRKNVVPFLVENNLLENGFEFSAFRDGQDVFLPKFYVDGLNDGIRLSLKFDYGEFIVDGLERENFSDKRNYIKEHNIKRIISECGFRPYKDFYFIDNQDEIFDFFEKGLKIMSREGDVFFGEKFNKKTVNKNANVSVGVKLSGNLLDINFETSDFDTDEISDMIEQYKLKKKYFKLKNGDYIKFNENIVSFLEFFDIVGDDFKYLDNKAGSVYLPKFKAPFVESLIKDRKQFFNTDDSYNKFVKKFDELKYVIGNFDFSGFNCELREYQKKGVYWLKGLSELGLGGILADDMGLGKTIEIIAIFFMEYSRKAGDNDKTYLPSIIVCPNSLLYNWENEFKRFAPDIETVVVSGTTEQRKKIVILPTKTCIYITTYDILKKDIELYENINFKYVIADEAQNIKNFNTLNAKAVKRLNSEVRFALTGTPIENSLSELWSIFDFVLPEYLGNIKYFQKKFENPVVKYGDMFVSESLKKVIAPFVLRRIKDDVLKELPEKNETVLYADMTEEQKFVYSANMLKAKKEVIKIMKENLMSSNRFQILAYITRLRQICCHPALFKEGYCGGSGKLDITMELISDCIESKHRILLFSQFTSMLEIIKKALDNKNIGYLYLDGNVKSNKRIEMVERFNGGEKDIFLISLKAGGTGLNLTGADVVIHFDPWWNPAVMNQASDRAYRFGQSKNVNVFYIVAKNSIEEKIIELQERKKILAESVIKNGDNFISSDVKDFSFDDIAYVFGER